MKDKFKEFLKNFSLTEKLLLFLLTLIFSIGGWLTIEVLQATNTYAKQEALEFVKLDLTKIQSIYAKREELKYNKDQIDCNIKELSQKVNDGFNRMGDKIDRNNQAVNDKIDKVMLLLMRKAK